jgi:radical SAM superfamily enzyme YgiQ (UPF0313 family)
MKYHKILLTRPPTAPRGRVDAHPQPPLGLASIAAVLERKMKVLPVLDGNINSNYLSELKSVVKSESPDIVGFSAYTPFAGAVMESARAIKEINPNILVVVGGPHATVLSERTLEKCPHLDIAVCGEGEVTIGKIVEGDRFEEIRGIAYRNDGGKIRKTLPIESLSDLDTLPFPAYHLLPNFPSGYKPYPPRGAFGGVWASVVRSRGCPFNCIYCCRDASFGHVYRCNSHGYVISLLKYLNTKFGVNDITFYDDVFTLNRGVTMKLLRDMRPQNLGFSLNWDCETRVDLVDPELILAMKKAGCKIIAYGIEHGLWINEIKGGRATVKQAERAIRWTHEAGIQTIGYFMIGLPRERPETILKTIEFAKKLDVTWAQFSVMVPIPGSELYRQAVEKGPGIDEEWDKLVYENLGKMDFPLLATRELSKDDLIYWRRRAYSEFYLRGQYVLRRLLSTRNVRDLGMNIEGLKLLMHAVMNY